MTLISVVLTAILVFCVTIILVSKNSTPTLQGFYQGFNYIKFLVQVFGVWLGFLYFYKNQSNQKKTLELNLLQKKIDEGKEYLDELENRYIDGADLLSQNKDVKNTVSSINLLGEKIFKFVESHSTVFNFSNVDLVVLQSLYSISSDENFDRAFDKNRVYSLISESRVLLWSKLNS